ncbi:MAG: ABC transporter permease [Acidiphilium sp.]
MGQTRSEAILTHGSEGAAPDLAVQWRRFLHFQGPGLRNAAVGLLSLAAALLFWQEATVHQLVFFVRFTNVPTPAQVLAQGVAVVGTPAFRQDLLVSCYRVFAGFSVAALVAVPLGLVMARWSLAKSIVFPVLEVLRPIPAIAWVPISIMLWPSNEQSIVFITFLGSFFPIVLNTMLGVAGVDPVLQRAAASLGARGGAIFTEVLLPGAAPSIFTGLNVGIGVAWVSLIAAEMISGQSGIGYFTWNAYSLIQYPDIVLGMIAIGLLGLGSSIAIRGLALLAMPWGRA